MQTQGRGGACSFDREPSVLSAATSPSVRRAGRPPDAKAVDEALLLLARSVQQFHTYPPGSPICQQAVDACIKAIVSLDSRDTVSFRVAPNALVVDEEPVGTGTLIEQGIARRLHQASIAEVTGTSFSIPMTVIKVSGRVRHIRPLPSDSTTARVPDSATPKFAP